MNVVVATPATSPQAKPVAETLCSSVSISGPGFSGSADPSLSFPGKVGESQGEGGKTPHETDGKVSRRWKELIWQLKRCAD